MHLLSLTNCPLDSRTGSGKTVIAWTEGMRALGHTVGVIEPCDYAFSRGPGRRLKNAYGAWRALENHLRQFQPDVIEFYGSEFWLATQKLSKLAGHPLLVAHTNGLEPLHSERSAEYQQHKDLSQSLKSIFSKLVYEQLEPLAFKQSDAFVALCELDREYAVQRKYYAPDNTAVIPPGLDKEYIDLPPPNMAGRQNRIAFTGQWTERKGPQHVVKVMKSILHANNNYTLDVFGTNSNEAVIGTFPDDLRGRIKVHPQLSNKQMCDELSKCKIFFLPSEYEGFGIAIAEAMACGCAAVVTPTGFGAELVDGEEALICQFGAVNHMVKAIAGLIDDEELAMRLSNNGWLRTRTMDWNSSIKRLSDTYETWLRRGRAARLG